MGRAAHPTAGGALPVTASADEYNKVVLTAKKRRNNRMAIPNALPSKPEDYQKR
jgi:hypothetical protein